ncbi:hypothetical protein [Ornithinimicrobium faecis]|uniref:hypothetical protein n=1 Tax=Ornithinimicrobium faecis TaxID=2934158 RepID=UPI002118610B|nr:hypothetical protein [Ornithinimicrobium sp. HY1745]
MPTDLTPGGAAPGGPALEFPDVESLHDLGTFVRRARTLMDQGSVRLLVSGGVLAAWVCVLPGRGLVGQGVVLGLRTMPLTALHGVAELDTTVPLAAVSDRLARRAGTGDLSTVLPVPPMENTETWTALTPARSGWEQVGIVAGDDLLEVAKAGISEIAQGAPEGSGGHAVEALRKRVWERSVADGALTAGVGLAAYGLGFVRPGAEVSVFRAGPWTRASTPVGHILTR